MLALAQLSNIVPVCESVWIEFQLLSYSVYPLYVALLSSPTVGVNSPDLWPAEVAAPIESEPTSAPSTHNDISIKRVA